eukprot:364230-Chlamydomonas_euryale.AAC.10
MAALRVSTGPRRTTEPEQLASPARPFRLLLQPGPSHLPSAPPHPGVDPMRIGFALMMGASSSFISPFGYQTNLMVFNAGNLKFWDLAKIGIFFQSSSSYQPPRPPPTSRLVLLLPALKDTGASPCRASPTCCPSPMSRHPTMHKLGDLH